MSLAYILDDLFADHRPPNAHPERPERVVAVRKALREACLDNRGAALPVRQADETEIGLVHSPGYVADLIREVPGKSGWLDGDTYFSPGTWPAALAAAGAVIDLASALLDGQFQRGLAVIRPPGHHAEADRAMGFCLLNNVAIAAASARARGASRVAIVDWDVHHGNGIQHIFERDSSVMYLSCHQYPFYPGTGACDEVGKGEGAGATVNVALPSGSGDRDYAAVFDEVFVPELRRFSPDLILVSAGFDAHQADPLAWMEVTRGGYRYMAARLVEVADEVCEGRIVCALEGGYDLEGLAEGFTAVLDVLDPREPPDSTPPRRSPGPGQSPARRDISRGARAAIVRTKQSLTACRGESE
ncbi:MAG: histone deacetylase [Proteobacteria bacterium]|nr:histone deacetylase [Pseudomonadota bacterium]